MKYTRQITAHKRSCNTRSLVITLFLSIIIIQVSLAFGANLPTVLAASHIMNCVNPLPPNNGATAPPAPATPGIIAINEVLSFPQSQWNCTASNSGSPESNAWIEIYNPQNQPYDLYADRASIDEGPGTDPYVLSLGSVIPSYGFLVVFPFPSNAYTQLPPIRLLFNSQVVIDQVSTPTLPPDTSYARIPDGSNNWQITTIPTIGNSNQYPTATVPTTQTSQTQNKATKQKSTATHSGSTSNDKTSTDPASTGVQPTWSTLLLPSPEPNYLTTQQGNTSLSSASATTSAYPFDLLKKTIFTLLILFFFSAPLCGWLFYKKKRATKSHS